MPEGQLTLIQLFIEPTFYITSPSKRIFWLYLLSSALLACVVLVKHGNTWHQIADKLLSPSRWCNASSRLDIQWLWFNHAVRLLIVIPLLGGQLSFALWLNTLLYRLLGEGNIIETQLLTTSIIFTLSLLLVDDFSRYLLHRLYHRVPLLWRFHAIHHSAPTLTPLTLYRIHCVEMLINSCRSLVVVGGLSGLFIYAFAGTVAAIDIYGASLSSILFNMAGANLRHSSVWVGFGVLEKIFISPAQHQIHHSDSLNHRDRNFGAALAIWDVFFNSWMGSRNERVTSFGIAGKPVEQKMLKQIFGISP